MIKISESSTRRLVPAVENGTGKWLLQFKNIEGKRLYFFYFPKNIGGCSTACGDALRCCLPWFSKSTDYDFQASYKLERILDMYYDQFGIKPRWVYYPIKSFRKYAIKFDATTMKPYLDELHDNVVLYEDSRS